MKRYVTRFWLLIMAIMMMCTAVFAEGIGTLGIADDYRFAASGGNVWVVSDNNVKVYNVRSVHIQKLDFTPSNETEDVRKKW